MFHQERDSWKRETKCGTSGADEPESSTSLDSSVEVEVPSRLGTWNYPESCLDVCFWRHVEMKANCIFGSA